MGPVTLSLILALPLQDSPKPLASTATGDAFATYIKASNSDRDDRFGSALAASGNLLLVGAPQEDSSAVGVNGDEGDDEAVNAGAAYLLARGSQGWLQQAYLKASNTDDGDAFGRAVAASGDTLAVGAPAESSAAIGVNGDQTDNSAGSAGAVYVFRRVGDVWRQEAYLKAFNTEADDEFGASLALDGDTLVVGAPYEGSSATGVNGNGALAGAKRSGAAYVFRRGSSGWSQEAYLKASNTEAFDSFGVAVAIEGDTIAVGASGEDSAARGPNGDPFDNSSLASGAVYTFVRQGSIWSPEAYLKSANSGFNDQFGASLSLGGGTLVVGAPGEASAGQGLGADPNDNSALDAGAAYVWERTGAGWNQVAYLKASNAEAADRFGWSVAAGEHTALVGAQGEASHAVSLNGNQSNNLLPLAGAAYAFERDAGGWRQSAYIKASNTTRADFFGRDVALAGDTFFVGAAREDGAARGINAANNNRRPDSGAAYAYVLPAARVALRNAGTNPESYRATPAILGGLWSASVDLATSGHPLALVRGFAEVDERPLPGGQVLLVSGAPVFQSALQLGGVEQGQWSARVPGDPAFAGLRLYTQAIQFGGDRPFVLSNAQDLVVGF